MNRREFMASAGYAAVVASALGNRVFGATESGAALVSEPAGRRTYMDRMLKLLVQDLGPHPTGSKEIEIAQDIYLAEMRKAIPSARFERHWTEWQEIYPGAQLVLDGHRYIDVKACVGSLPTPVKGHWGVLRKIDRDGIPYALVDEKTGEVLVQIEISPFVGPVPGYMIDKYTMEITRFCLGQEDVPTIEEAVANKTPAWAHLRAMYYPPNASNNIVAEIPGDLKNEEILFVSHLDVFPICAGPNDNTGACILALMLAHQFAGRKLKRPVTLLCSGSHEINSGGVQHYIKKRRMEGTIGNIRYLFVIDGLSFSPDFFIDSRDQGLKDLIQQIHTDLKISTKLVIRDQHGYQNDGYFFRDTTDTRCVWMDGQDPNGPQRQHTTMDNLELFSHEGVETKFLILRELVERLQAAEIA